MKTAKTITREQLRKMRKRADREREIARGFSETVTRIHKSKKTYDRKNKDWSHENN